MTFPEPTGTPSWETRVRPGAYTAPSGVRILYDFEDVAREIDLRRSVFEFPGVDGVYIQRNKVGARRYPLRCYFSGDSHDLEATAFEAALMEDGVGRLEHPLYGTFDVVPMGTITRRDNLVTGANQSIVETTFWPPLRVLYPTGQESPENEILASLGNFDVQAAQMFSDLMSLETIVKQVSLKEAIRKTLNEISQVLGTVSKTTSEVNRLSRDAQSILNYALDVLVGQPLLLAQQIINLTTLPSRALAGIADRLAAYGELADRLFGSEAGRPGERIGTALDRRQSSLITNEFHLVDLTANAAVDGSVQSALNTTFRYRPDALGAAVEIFDQFDALVAWRDAAFTDLADAGAISGTLLDQVDTGGPIQSLGNAVATTAGNLVEISFSLLPERRIVLDRPRNLLELASELYPGDVDPRLDELISNNGLTGDEILELPPGRTIAYYPEPS